MTSPKPTASGRSRIHAADLTTRGTPRKRAAGAGRPALSTPRTITLPRCSTTTHQQLHAIAAAIARPGRSPCLADAIEHAARVAHSKLKTQP
jgi:hypothetical protein